MTDDDSKTPRVTNAPLYLMDPDTTDPHSLLTSDISQSQRRLLELSMREGGEPVPWVAFIKTLDSLDRFKGETVKAVNVLNNAVDPQRLERIEDMARATRTQWKGAKKWAIAAILSAGGSIGGLATWAIKAADAHGVDSQRLNQAEKDNDRQDRTIESIREMCMRLGQRSDLNRSLPVADAIPPALRLAKGPDHDQ